MDWHRARAATWWENSWASARPGQAELIALEAPWGTAGGDFIVPRMSPYLYCD